MKYVTKILRCLALCLCINSSVLAGAQTTSGIANKMAQMQLVLPKASTPIASYLPYVIVDDLVFISGQLPLEEGRVKFTGRLGDSLSEEEGIAAAKLAALNILAQLKVATGGSLDKVKRCVKLSGFVNSTADFTAHPKIINGASDLIVELFGEQGKHTRSAFGVSALPLNAAVEIEAIFQIEQ